jgi:hypothetical protein
MFHHSIKFIHQGERGQGKSFPKPNILFLSFELFSTITKVNHTMFNPFNGDFDLPKRKCFNELFWWFFFDKVRHTLKKIQLW